MVYKLTDFCHLPLCQRFITNMVKCDNCDKGFIRRDNMLRHKRTIHGADNEELADKYKDSDTEFEHDDDIDTDEDASFEEEEESLDAEEDPWNEIIVEAFEECQSKYEDRVKR